MPFHQFPLASCFFDFYVLPLAEAKINKLCAWRHASAPCKLTISSYLFARWYLFRHVGYLRHQQQVDILTLKVVSESRVTWPTSEPILVFLGLSVLELGSMYATDVSQTSDKSIA